MDRKLLAAFLGTAMCSSAQAIVFSPTDTTVNFVPILGVGPTLIGLFDDSDMDFSGGYLAVQSSGDQASFSPTAGGFSLSNASGLAPTTFALSGSDYFTLAAWSPLTNSWLAPDAVYCSAVSSSCALSWSGILVELAVDLVETPPFAAIPIPSSVFLFGSGLMGLTVVARRRVAHSAGVPMRC
ncbi:MAG TPA: hypothetical protein VIR60_08450 [Gammaproteobacteria bacterium]